MINRYKKRFALWMALLMLLTSVTLDILAETVVSRGVSLRGSIISLKLTEGENGPDFNVKTLQAYGTAQLVLFPQFVNATPAYTADDVTWTVYADGATCNSYNIKNPSSTLTPEQIAAKVITWQKQANGSLLITPKVYYATDPPIMGNVFVSCSIALKQNGVVTDTFKAGGFVKVEEKVYKIVFHSNYPADAKKVEGQQTITSLGAFTTANQAEVVHKYGQADVGTSIKMSPKFETLNYQLLSYNTQPDGSGTNYRVNSQMQLVAPPSGSGDSIHLYAQWQSSLQVLDENGNPVPYWGGAINPNSEGLFPIQRTSRMDSNHQNPPAGVNPSYFHVTYSYKWREGGRTRTSYVRYIQPAVLHFQAGTLNTTYYADMRFASEVSTADRVVVSFQLRDNSVGAQAFSPKIDPTKIKGYNVTDARGKTKFYPLGAYVPPEDGMVPRWDSDMYDIIANAPADFDLDGGTSGRYHIDAEIVMDAATNSDIWAQFFVIRRDGDNPYNPSQSNFYNVGSGVIHTNVPVGGSFQDDVGIYVDETKRPSAAQIASIMNIPMTAAETVKWYKIYNRDNKGKLLPDGWHVNGVVKLPSAYHRVDFVDYYGNTVNNVTVEDAEALPLNEVPDGSALKAVPGKRFSHWELLRRIPGSTERQLTGHNILIGSSYVDSELQAVIADEVIKAVYEDLPPVEYKVEYYYQSESATTPYMHFATDDRVDYASIGSNVVLTAEDKKKTQNDMYVFDDTNPNNVYSITVDADPTKNVLKAYYKKVTKTIKVVKNWTGTGVLLGAPASFVLKRGSKQIDSFTLEDTNNVSHQAIYTTPVFVYSDTGVPYTYTVQETTSTPGYIKTNAVTGDTYTFTNEYYGLPKNITFTLTWDWETPTGPADPKATPNSVSLVLKRNGESIEEFTMSSANATSATEWEKTFSNQPMYAPDGTAYVYSIKETVPSGYSASENPVTATGGEEGVALSIHNQYTGGLVSGVESWRTATKTFSGGPQMTVDKVNKLLALQRTTANHPALADAKIAPNTVLLKSVTDEGNNVFKYSWGPTLWSYDAYGDEYIYRVVEIDPEGSQYTDATVVSGIATIDDNEYNVVPTDEGITNEYIVPKTDVTGFKVWDLTNAESGGVVPLSYVSLYRKTNLETNYSFVPVEVKAVGNIYVEKNEPHTESFTWTGLDKTDRNGNLYNYIVRETDENGNPTGVPGYQKTEEDKTVTNTYDGITGADGSDMCRTVTVDKAWVGAHSGFTISADVTLHRQIPAAKSGVPYAPEGQSATKTLSTNQATSLDQVPEATWTDLPRYFVNGEEYIYTVKETPITIGYTHTISEPVVDGNLIKYSITNTYDPDLIPVKATKVWKAVSGLTIEGVTVPSLLLPLQRCVVGTEDWQTVTDAEGKPLSFDFGNREVPADSGSTLTVEHTWKNLPRSCACGRVYKYRIIEENVPNGYIISGDGLNLINTYNGMSPGSSTMWLMVRKKWEGLNTGEFRPDVYMYLFRNDITTWYVGYVTAHSKPEDGSDTLFIFDALNTNGKLLRYAPDGTAYTYTVKEGDYFVNPVNGNVNPIYGYEVEGIGAINEGEELVVTNTRNAGEIGYTIEKQWQDANGAPLPSGTNVPDAKFVVLEVDEDTGEPGAELTQYAHTFSAHELTGDMISYEFTFPQYSTYGLPFAYFIQEVVPNGYTAAYPNLFYVANDGSGTAINTYDGNTNNQDPSQSGPVSLTFKKQWNNLPQGFDVSDLPAVTLILKQNGTVMNGAEYKKEITNFTTGANGEVQAEWVVDGLIKYAMDGTEFVYTVEEETVPNGYVKSHSPDGKTVINTYTGGVTEDAPLELTIEKIWENVPVGKTLPKVQLSLYRDNGLNPVATAEIEPQTYELNLEQTFTFIKDGANNTGELLPRYNPAGEPYIYTIKETPINGYVNSLTDTNNTVTEGEPLSIINTYDGETNHATSEEEPININLTNMTGLMVDEASYPNIQYTLTRKSAKTEWELVDGASIVFNSALSFTGGDGEGKFTKVNAWENQKKFAYDGTAYWYSVNTKYNSNPILVDGVDAPDALAGYNCRYSKGDHLPGGWVPGQNMIEVQHAPIQGVLKLTNEYLVSGKTIIGDSFKFAIGVEGGGGSAPKVIGKTVDKGYYEIESGETVYITGVKHGDTLTVTEQDHENYTLFYAASTSGGAELNDGVSLANGKLSVTFNPDNFNSTTGLHANVVLTNAQGELAVRQSFVAGDDCNGISWPISTVKVSVKKNNELYGEPLSLTQEEPYKIIKVPYGEYTLAEIITLKGTEVINLGDSYTIKVAELSLTDNITPSVWDNAKAINDFSINVGANLKAIRVINRYTQTLINVISVEKQWVNVPEGASLPLMQFRLRQRDRNNPEHDESYADENGVVTIPVPFANQSVSFFNVPDDGPGDIDYYYDAEELYQGDPDKIPNGYERASDTNDDGRTVKFINTYNGTSNNEYSDDSGIVTVSITKVWKGLRQGHVFNPPNATFTLYRSYSGRAPEEVLVGVGPAVYDADNDDIVNAYEKGGIWLVDNTAEVVSKTDLPKFAPDGTEYEYSVRENNIPLGYSVVIEKDDGENVPSNTFAFTVTNTYQPGTYGTVDGTIALTKKWENIPVGTKTQGMLPYVTVTLKDVTDGGNAVATIDALSAATGSSSIKVYATKDENSFAVSPTGGTTIHSPRLVKYRPDGKAFEFKLEESTLNGYTCTSTPTPAIENSVETYAFINSYQNNAGTAEAENKVTVTVNKTWNNVPSSATVNATLNFYKNNVSEPFKTETLNFDKDNPTVSHEWTLLKYAPDGSQYNYTVKEVPVNGYRRVVSEPVKDDHGNSVWAITNTYDGETEYNASGQELNNPVTLTVKNNWTGLSAGSSVPEITIKVYNDEAEEVGSLNFGGGTAHQEEKTISGVRRYKPNGEPYTFYGVQAQVPNGYKLMDGEHVVDNPTVYRFVASDYTITVTNNFKSETIPSFTVEKKWMKGDADTDMENVAVPNIWVQLKQSFTVGSTTTTVDYGLPKLIMSRKAQSDSRKATWENLPKYSTQGDEYTYSAIETTDLTKSGYLAPDVVGGEGTVESPYVIKNIYDTSSANKYTLSGTKTWTGLPDEATGATCSFVLLRKESNSTDISNIAGAVTEASDADSHIAALEFDNDNKDFFIYAPSGQKYLYWLQEDVPKGYEATVERTVKDDDKTIEFNVTNKYTGTNEFGGTRSVTGEKVWAGIAPNTVPAKVASATLQLYRAEKDSSGDIGEYSAQGNSKTLYFNSALEANATWTDLAYYAPSGNEYVYEVREDVVPKGYVKSVDAANNIITNTYDISPSAEKTTFTGIKKWADLPDADAVGAPVYLQLKQSMTYKLNDEDIAETVNYGSAVLMLDSKNTETGQPGTTHIASNEWTDLPKYALNGKEYTYSVDEVRIPNGYTYEKSPDGTTITNTYDGMTVNSRDDVPDSFTVTVKWVNIPENETGATVELQLNKTVGLDTKKDSPIVSVEDTETTTHEKEHTWENLFRFAPNGSAYIYSADLVSVPDGYTAQKSYDGKTFTLTYDGMTNNTMTPAIKQTHELLASKRWENLPVGENGTDVTLRLKKVEGSTVTNYDTATDKVLTDNGSHYATAVWNGLPKYAPSGAEYKYIVRELNIPKGYIFSQAGNNITNTFDGLSLGGTPIEPGNPLDSPADPGNTSDKVTVDATKTWIVNGKEVLPGSMTLPTVYLQLKRVHVVDGVVTNVINEGEPKALVNGAKDAQWTDLLKYAPDGTEYVYVVHEVSTLNGYKMVQNGNVIINTYDGVTMGGIPNNLPTPGQVLTNPTDPGSVGAVTVPVTVEWEGVPDGATVPTIAVQLWRNGKPFGRNPGAPNPVWTNLDKYAPDGAEYQYNVSLVDIPKGYTMVQTGTVQDGFTITLTYDGVGAGGTPDNLPNVDETMNNPTDPGNKNYRTITVEKIWNNVPSGTNVPLIQVKLWQNGVEHGKAKVIDRATRQAEWTNLIMYAPNGTEFKYNVSEANIPKGYFMVQSYDGNDGFIITNTYDGVSKGGKPDNLPTPKNFLSDPTPTDPSIKSENVVITTTKTWAAAPGLKLDLNKAPTIEVQLYQNGAVYGNPKEIVAPGKTAQWTDLPRYSPEGNNYIYTISEVNIPFGYAYSQIGYEITNTYDGVSLGGSPIPPANKIDSYTRNTDEFPFNEKDPSNNPTDPDRRFIPTRVKVTNRWENVPEEATVPQIAVRLYQNGKVADVKPLAPGETELEWTNLPRYSLEGERCIYTVSQVEVPKGYTYTQVGYNLTNTYDGLSFGGEPTPPHIIPDSDAINPESFFNLTDPEHNPTNPDTGKETPITVTATKKWENVPQGVAVPAVEIQLWQNGNKIGDIVELQPGDTTAKWPELNVFGPDGEKYQYNVSEVNIPKGYRMLQSGFAITNTYDGVSKGGEPINLPTTENPMSNPTDPNEPKAVDITDTSDILNKLPVEMGGVNSAGECFE